MSYNVIAVDVRYAVPREGLAGGTITPGMLIQPSSSNWIAHAVEGGSSDFIAGYLMEDGISETFASGEFLPYYVLKEGDLVNVPLTTSQTITIGDKLTSAGNGYLKEAGTGLHNVGSGTNYVPITPVGNKAVRVAFVDPAANTQALAVTINGNYIKVSLATDGSGVITSTPALIKAAIEAVSGYDDLVSLGTVVGTGAVTADDVLLEADAVFGIAENAVTTTTSASRVLVRKGAAQ